MCDSVSVRFYCSDFSHKEWKNIEIPLNKTEEQFILQFCENEFTVNDCDGGSDDYYYFGFSSGKYYEVYHEFFANKTYNEEEDCMDFEVINDFFIKEISKETAKKKGVSDDRNYLKLITENKQIYWPKGWKEFKEKYQYA